MSTLPPSITLPPRPSWLAEHDDGEPRIILCPPDRAASLRFVVEVYGMTGQYTVTEDTGDVLPPGQLVVAAPGLIWPKETTP